MAKEFKLPEIGDGIDAGTVVAVLVKPGDNVEVDQTVLELETDKAVVEIPSSVAGRVESVAVEANAEIRVGQVVITVAEGESAGAAAKADAAADEEAGATASKEVSEDGADPDDKADDSAPAADDGKPAATTTPPAGDSTGAKPAAATPVQPARSGAAIPAAPSVRRLARERGVDLASLQGSGILGRISAADVLAGPSGAAAAAVPAFKLPDFSKWGATERKPMSGIRKTTVRSMATAWATVPMVTHFDKADATDLEAFRKRYQKQADRAGAKIAPTALLVGVVASALRRFPDFNASIDTETSEIVYKDYVNITVAVDTPNGLLVPVIRDADRKNLITLSLELAELAEKARDRKLSLEDMQGGNFSISNLGGIGGTGFTPIVSPPEVAILGVSRSVMEPVYDAETGGFEARLMMPLALTYDHRLIDGAAAARFLRWICQAIEDPFLLAFEG